jgi:hypothetical protein
MKFIKKLLKLFRRILHGDVMRVLNDDVILMRTLNDDVIRTLNDDVVRILSDSIMRTLNDDIMHEINYMKTEIQYMKSVFAKREHLFDMAADIKNHISLLHDNNEKTRS